MSKPSIERHGDAFLLTWPDDGIGFGIDHLRDSHDELKGMLTVEACTPEKSGRMLGPVSINLLSTRSQSELAGILQQRVNGVSKEIWLGKVIQACAMVSAQWQAPTPTVDLSTFEDVGEVEYLLPGLLPLGETSVLYGDGESAKSLIALHVAACVALGAATAWGSKPKQGKVLYLDWETNTRTVASRLRRLALGMSSNVPHIEYRQCVRSLVDELPNILEEISRKHISLVVVDSIGFAVAGALVEDETARAAMNALRQLGPVTRLVVAHVSHNSANEAKGRAKPFGSAFFWNGMRSGIEVRRAEDTPRQDVIDVGLFHRKANDGLHHRPIALTVAFDGTRGPIAIDEGNMQDVPDLAVRTPLSQRLRAAMTRGERSVKDLAVETEESENAIRTTLGRMSGVQRIHEGSRGISAVWGLVAE